jgi:hypothetical protein
MICDKARGAMLRVPEEIRGRFDAAMTSAGVDRRERWQFGKRLRYYLDFCSKYQAISGFPNV